MTKKMENKAHKVIINACLSGVVHTKKDSRYLPITPKEIIRDALSAAGAGAAIVHIHPRDDSGAPTWKKSYLEKIIAGIKESNDKLLISVSTSGRLWNDFDKRAECLSLKGDLKPDLASLTPGSMNFMHQESVNSPAMIERLALTMQQNGIKPELEIYEPGMIHKANYLLDRGIISNKKPYFNLFFGSLGTSPLHPSVVASYLALLPGDAVWCGAGIGKFQLTAHILSLGLGGGLRAGLEDNIYFDSRKKTLASNSTFVGRLAQLIKLMDLEIASADETKNMLF
ncbi:MAG: 3-keto-5-aminohexanoate cleavage protein [Dehalococcoidia bacterium]|jgi:uncharacterized protein (DUF849 family)